MLSTPQKREAETEANEKQQVDAPVKSTRTPSNLMKWKLWLIANYEYAEDALTKTNDIFKHAEDEKDRVTGESHVPSNKLGMAVTHLFGDKVRLVRKGPRTGRHTCYVNLKRRQRLVSDPAGRKFEFSLPERWVKIKDHSSHVSFIRHEGWEFNNQRGTTELSVVENDNQELTLEVKCHGRALDFKTEFASILHPFPAEEQVWIVIQFIERSSLCMGFEISSDEGVVAMLPHASGVFKTLTRREVGDVKRAFSLGCLVFAAPKNSCCLKCSTLLQVDNQRKRRLGKRGSTIAPCCNDRYLTKTEMHKKYKQLSKERQTASDVTAGTDSSDE